MSQSRSSEEKQESVGLAFLQDACLNLSYGLARVLDDAYLYYYNKALKNSIYSESQFESVFASFKQFVSAFWERSYPEIKSLYNDHYTYFLMNLIQDLFDNQLELADRNASLQAQKRQLLNHRPSLVAVLNTVESVSYSAQE